MTQQEFSDCLGAALTWMQDVQERLKAIDNTQGPRDALEARLRETEVRLCPSCSRCFNSYWTQKHSHKTLSILWNVHKKLNTLICILSRNKHFSCCFNWFCSSWFGSTEIKPELWVLAGRSQPGSRSAVGVVTRVAAPAGIWWENELQLWVMGSCSCFSHSWTPPSCPFSGNEAEVYGFVLVFCFTSAPVPEWLPAQVFIQWWWPQRKKLLWRFFITTNSLR